MAQLLDIYNGNFEELAAAITTENNNNSNLLRTTVDTTADTAAKIAAVEGVSILTGLSLIVNFTNGNTAANPTLNVNGGGAFPLRTIYNDAVASIPANTTLFCCFWGDAWITTLFPEATTTQNGLMSAEDKQNIINALAQLITLAQEVQANSAAISNLEEMVLANLTTNPFSITFSDLSGGTLVSGIWNTTAQRIEC
jgi:hypothetical protein